jgi:activating signal cointegrator complex subunit 3
MDWLLSLGYNQSKTRASSKKKAVVIELTGDDVITENEYLRERLATRSLQPKRITHPGYEEYHIPPPPKREDTEPLIPISQLEDWAQLAFKGVTHLNRVQSRVFYSAYKTNENMLICAPTGCGKTNVAMLTMLREIGQHFRNGVLRREEFKMIYVAPMKALAQEMVTNFSKRLAALGIVVREMTGDMQLSKRDVQNTQLIITTPEKWDVVTRKATDLSLIQLVKLLIIDEVHLLAEDRGPVIESLVARTLRQVESTQSMIRIVGLSATLPNYEDVATFLRVNPLSGLYFFDNSYRPVPLQQQYIGVTVSSPVRRLQLYNEICYKKVEESLRAGNQVMVFVHARKATSQAAKALYEIAMKEGDVELFQPNFKVSDLKEIEKSRNREMRDVLAQGFGIHHAGMIRNDRHIVEKLFANGSIRVLCCTATLAWGVNLPAHTVVIKGTQVYNAKKGAFVELDMLDVMQIFGRAGRPQFDTSGEGIIITTAEQCPRYLNLLNHALPIESQMQQELANHLSAEVVLGTVTSVREAMQWLSYTYMFIRMLKNPLAYGISYEEKAMDPMLGGKRRELITQAAELLAKSKMVTFDEETGIITATDLGRVASHYYIHYETVQMINRKLAPTMDEPEILHLVASAKEFENVKVRDDEVEELSLVAGEVPVKIKGGIENAAGKINLLIQVYISRINLKNFSLISDCAYVVQSVGRIVRALFEIAIKRGWTTLVHRLLDLTKCLDRRLWLNQHPLRQFSTISQYYVDRLEQKNFTLSRLADLDAREIDELVNVRGVGTQILQCVDQFPYLDLTYKVQPITRTVLRIMLTITPQFDWNPKVHYDMEPWWVWIEDENSEYIYHSEFFTVTKDSAEANEPLVLNFTIPIREPKPARYIIRAVSDRWLGAEAVVEIPLKDVVLPSGYLPQTKLLPLVPLPLTVLQNEKYEAIYGKLAHYNPIQTQVFHTLYYTDHNVLIGAPTGSGKTLIAEMAIFRLWNTQPKQKVVYIAPLKALVRERVDEWTLKLCKPLNKRLVELTGDFTPDIRLLKNADIVVTTPEKWDGISRNWQERGYVRDVGLIIMDEIHLLGSERGAILEVIVSRMRYVAWYTGQPIRMLGLSSTLANARDLADWLGITSHLGLYNFRPSVRPVPLSVRIQGFAGKHYCPRMASMNRPAYAAILKYSRKKPVLIFVSSRRQTRLTAADLISYCAADENPTQFVRMTEQELQYTLSQVSEQTLRHTLQYGIGIHHAGLTPSDKSLVENLFVNEKIQVLVCTSTLAWGVNFPAHLVIIKGTEFFDPKTSRYEDYPITDVLQMMGRAGRPQFDNEGKAYIMVQDVKKNFYKKFLYEPFPVESSLQDALHDHLNAEIVSGTIKSRQDAMDYLTWTFMFRRLVQNPSYYDLEDVSFEGLNKWMTNLIGGILSDLSRAGCIEFDKEDNNKIFSTALGTVSSYYYLNYLSAADFSRHVTATSDHKHLLRLISEAKEFEELPVRHNEDKLNKSLADVVPLGSYSNDYESSHVKTYLLLQAHLSRTKLPIADYQTDLKTVLDNTIRVIQSFIDMAAEKGHLNTALTLMNVMQMILQGQWHTDNAIMMLPYMDTSHVQELSKNGIKYLPQLMDMKKEQGITLVSKACNLRTYQVEQLWKVVENLPSIDVTVDPNYVRAEGALTVTIHLRDLRKGSPKSYIPRFPKSKDEGWWLAIGDLSKQELMAMRRVKIKKEAKAELVIPDTKDTSLTVFLISDCYLGIDQQYDFKV